MGMRRWAARNKGRVVGHSAVVAHWHGWVGVWGAASCLCLRALEQSSRSGQRCRLQVAVRAGDGSL
jgi:hypothetical protein